MGLVGCILDIAEEASNIQNTSQWINSRLNTLLKDYDLVLMPLFLPGVQIELIKSCSYYFELAPLTLIPSDLVFDYGPHNCILPERVWIEIGLVELAANPQPILSFLLHLGITTLVLLISEEVKSFEIFSDIIKLWSSGSEKRILIKTESFTVWKKIYSLFPSKVELVYNERIHTDFKWKIQKIGLFMSRCILSEEDPNIPIISKDHSSKKQKDYSIDFVNVKDQFLNVFLSPIQPSSVNIPSSIYRSMEADKVKYEMYHKAIYSAIESLPRSNINVLIAGAGRGPLINIVRRVAETLAKNVMITAVEKNQFAFATYHYCVLLLLINRLLDLRRRDAWNGVNLIFEDIRYLKIKSKFDIIISELLGSFGDNELAPECLQNIYKQNHLIGGDFITIPESFQSYIAPVEYPISKSVLSENNLSSESPYIVHSNSINLLAIPQPVFSFDTKTIIESKLDSRHATLHFDLTNVDGGEVDGFIGTFSARLYKEIEINISKCPSDSWFPMFFPLQKSLLVKGRHISVDFIRGSCKDYCWYAWRVDSEGAAVGEWHNSTGKYFKMNKN